MRTLARSLAALAVVPVAAITAIAAARVAPASSSAASSRGPVDVYYAASLTEIMDAQIGPAFENATGYEFVGFPGESKELASEIRAGLVRADVFISASRAVTTSLEGKPHGNLAEAPEQFGRTNLELGYNPRSRFAAKLKARPWWAVVVQPGFSLGRTDPSTDPKGVLAVRALDEAAAAHHLPALRRDADQPSVVYPEASLVGRVQSGQLDAGFFYSVEAVAAHLPAVGLGEQLYAGYTAAVLNRSPHSAGARAFVAFLLGPKAQSLLRRDGMQQ